MRRGRVEAINHDMRTNFVVNGFIPKKCHFVLEATYGDIEEDVAQKSQEGHVHAQSTSPKALLDPFRYCVGLRREGFMVS